MKNSPISSMEPVTLRTANPPKPPLFVVPPELTANIPDRKPKRQPPGYKSPRHFGPVPKYSETERRRRHLKLLLRGRHSGPKLDTYIARLEERLELLKEIREERDLGRE